MKQGIIFFKPFSKYGLEGYYIPVRNSFNNQLEEEFIPLKAKELFEAAYGQKIITDEEFLDWYSENAPKFQ
jgi:hypothetical protein